MTKEELKRIKNSIKATITKMFEDDMAADFNFAYLTERIEIVRDKIINLCNGNFKIASGLIDIAIKELSEELHNGKLKNAIKQINNKSSN